MLAFLEDDEDRSVLSLALCLFEMQWQNSHIKIAIKTEGGRGDSALLNYENKAKSLEMSAEGSVPHTCSSFNRGKIVWINQ